MWCLLKSLLQNYESMYNIKKLPELGKPFGRIFMAEDGKLFCRIAGTDCPPDGNYVLHIEVGPNGSAENMAAISNAKAVAVPQWLPDKVFSDGAGNYYIVAAEENESLIAAKAQAAGCGYMINRRSVLPPAENGVEFIDKNGTRQDIKVLFNEVGTPYRVVSLGFYGPTCKELFGYVEAEEIEPLVILSEVVGTPVAGLGSFLRQGEVLLKRLDYDEPFKLTREQLENGYEADGNIWRPKSGRPQQWVKAAENICAPYGGGFLFLPRPMVNITDETNICAIRHEVFSGNEIILGSHRITRRFLPRTPLTISDFRDMSAASGKYDLSKIVVLMKLGVRFEEVPVGVYQFL